MAMGGFMIGMPGVATLASLPVMKTIDSARNEDGLINRTWQNFKEPFTDQGGVFSYIKDDHGYNGDVAGRVAAVATLPLVPLIGVANIPVSIVKATYDTAKEMYDNYNKENYKEVGTQTEEKTFLDKELQTSEKNNNENLNHTI